LRGFLNASEQQREPSRGTAGVADLGDAGGSSRSPRAPGKLKVASVRFSLAEFYPMPKIEQTI